MSLARPRRQNEYRFVPVDQHLFILFLITTLVAMISPGPDMLFILGCGMRGGARAGLLATAGVATSEVVHITLRPRGCQPSLPPRRPRSPRCALPALATSCTWACRPSVAAARSGWRWRAKAGYPARAPIFAVCSQTW